MGKMFKQNFGGKNREFSGVFESGLYRTAFASILEALSIRKELEPSKLLIDVKRKSLSFFV